MTLMQTKSPLSIWKCLEPPPHYQPSQGPLNISPSSLPLPSLQIGAHLLGRLKLASGSSCSLLLGCFLLILSFFIISTSFSLSRSQFASSSISGLVLCFLPQSILPYLVVTLTLAVVGVSEISVQQNHIPALFIYLMTLVCPVSQYPVSLCI